MKLINHSDEQLIENIIDPIDMGRELNHASKKLRLIEDKFYKVFDMNPCPMSLSLMEDGTIIDVNEAFLKEVGMKHKSEMVGKTTIESGLKIIKEKDRDYIFNKILKNGKVENYPCSFMTLHGKKKKGLFSGTVMDLNNKKCLFLICQIVNNSCVANIFKTYFVF
jgi:hypothetical protein